MPTVHVVTRHGAKVHTADVDPATADFLERFGSAPSIFLTCHRYARIVRTPHPATSTPTRTQLCSQCARTHPGGTP